MSMDRFLLRWRSLFPAVPSWGPGIREAMLMPESELFEKGLAARRDVLGADYVNANLADIFG
jgi:hypothetical protein